MADLSKVAYIAFVLVAAIMIYQIIRHILGGSWSVEDLIIGLLLANLTFSFYLKESVGRIDSKLSGHIGWHKGSHHNL